LYSSVNIIRVSTSRETRSAEYAAQWGDMRNAYRILVINLKCRDLVGCVDGSIILKWVVKKWGMMSLIGFTWLKNESKREFL
jgi:hypothetical protein